MNKEEFLDTTRTDWWLVDREAEAEVTELRLKLGEAFGYVGEQDWYTKPERLEPLWSVVEAHRDLADRLEAAQVPNDYRTWLEEVIETKEAEAQAEQAPQAQNAQAPARTTESAQAATTAPAQQAKPAVAKQGLFGHADKDAEAATPNQPGPPPNKSPFAKKNDPPVQNIDVEELKSSIGDLLAEASIPLDAAAVDKLAANPNFAADLARAKTAMEAEAEAEVTDEELDEWDWDEDEEALEGAEN